MKCTCCAFYSLCMCLFFIGSFNNHNLKDTMREQATTMIKTHDGDNAKYLLLFHLPQYDMRKLHFTFPRNTFLSLEL